MALGLHRRLQAVSTSPTLCTALVGRPVLPGWSRRLDGQARHRPRRWVGHRREILPAQRGVPWPARAPDPTAGRRRFVGLVLLQLNAHPLRRSGASRVVRATIPDLGGAHNREDAGEPHSLGSDPS